MSEKLPIACYLIIYHVINIYLPHDLKSGSQVGNLYSDEYSHIIEKKRGKTMVL